LFSHSNFIPKIKKLPSPRNVKKSLFSVMATTSGYTLYHNYYSICSIMIRYLLAVRGEPLDAASTMVVEEKAIDIFNEEQLAEDYLLHVNPRGQVPVLGNPAVFDFPLAQSAAITEHIASRHPRLLPVAHKAEIIALVKEMHDTLNFFTLSFLKSPKLASGFKAGAERLLARDDISKDYRAALEFKRDLLEREKVHALEPEKMEAEVKKAKAYLAKISTLLPKEGPGPWLYGERHPTALDAHLVVMLARLQDAGRGSLITGNVKDYGEKAMQTQIYGNIMQGRTTMYDKPIKNN